jgi:hypothetical protein
VLAARGRQKVASRRRLLRVAKQGAIPVSNRTTCRALRPCSYERGSGWVGPGRSLERDD